MKKCPYCGEMIQDDALKCRFCGEWLETKPENEIASEEEVTDSTETPTEETVTENKSNEIAVVPQVENESNVVVKGKKKKNKKKIVITLCSILALLLICYLGYSSYIRSQVKGVVNDFFSAVKSDQTDIMKACYPQVGNLTSYAKSDKIDIDKVTSLGDSKYSVEVKNHFTNGFGKTYDKEMTMYVKTNAKEGKKVCIYDSKGFFMADTDDDPVYRYAISNGFLNSSQTDQVKATKLGNAASTLLTKAFSLRQTLQNEVVVKSWSWETGYYSDYASGRGVVKNNSPYTIKNLKYKVTYKTSSLSVITEDDGYVTYGEIAPYSSCSFSFYTSYVGNAKKASIELIFDDENLFEIAAGEN